MIRKPSKLATLHPTTRPRWALYGGIAISLIAACFVISQYIN